MLFIGEFKNGTRIWENEESNQSYVRLVEEYATQYGPKEKSVLYKVTSRQKSAILRDKDFKLETLDDLYGGVKQNMHICIEEDTEAFYEGQEPLVNPSSGEMITSGGMNVYRNTTVYPMSLQMVDEVLTRDTADVAVQASAED